VAVWSCRSERNRRGSLPPVRCRRGKLASTTTTFQYRPNAAIAGFGVRGLECQNHELWYIQDRSVLAEQHSKAQAVAAITETGEETFGICIILLKAIKDS